jgi:hypothetical protein
MDKLTALLDKFPIASAVFIVYAIAGGVAMATGTMTNEEYTDSLLKVGAATGAIGGARALVSRLRS